MKRLFFAFALLTLLTACGARVEVPPAHVGKIMTADGYQDNLIPTSKIWLPSCIFTQCDRLVLLDASDKAFAETLDIFIPKDKLMVQVQVRLTLSVAPPKTAELFNSLPPTPTDDANLSIIPAQAIYQTYAQQIVLTEVREFLSQYSISEISSSIEMVNNELRARLTSSVEKRTPFSVRYVGLTDVRYPDIITKAQENAAERREQIAQEEAKLQMSQVSLDRELKEARLRRQIEKEKSETEAEGQKILSQTVDRAVLDLRRLENEAAWIAKWDGKLPITAMGDAVPMVTIGK